RANLGAGTGGASSPQAQLLHQDICGGGEQDTELVGPEAGATGAVDLQVVQFLDAILDVAPLAVDMFVNPLRALFHIGDDKTGIVFGVFVGSTDDLGFDDDAARAGPRPGGVADFPIDMFSLPAAPRELTDSPHSGGGDVLQHCIFGHGDDIVESGLGVQKR